mmetsp:Transcript_8625/g.24198  ORF Transcript_8625/g.24198 Transcript_8625/m.24198 type:complete len:252 (-) Transcript_8625:1092-1847(-)
MVADKDHLLGTHRYGNQSLRLDGLRRLIDQNLAEAEILETGITGSDARATNHIGRLQDLPLCTAAEGPPLPLIPIAQFTDLFLETLQLVEFVTGRQRGHNVQAKMVHRTGGLFPSLGGETDHTQTARGNLLRQLIYGDVTGCRHEDLAHPLLGEMIDEGRGRHSLAGSWRSLDETQRTLQDLLHGLLLTLVERGKSGDRELSVVIGRGDLDVGNPLLLDGMAQKAVVDVARDTGIVDGKGLERVLHPIERR